MSWDRALSQKVRSRSSSKRIGLRQSGSQSGVMVGGMPAALEPKPTGTTNRAIIMTIVIQVESIESGTFDRANAYNTLTVATPDKMA